MCGIVGAFGKQPGGLQTALKLLKHRGPDGHHHMQLGQAVLGHTRLAIVDVDGGHQPMADASGARWLICNGEIYNHPELRTRYDDYPFQTQADSEDILAVYAQHGQRTPQHLEGMYAFAIAQPQQIFLARDPLGIKPLYYAESDDAFYFASEIKALQHLDAPVQEFPPGTWYSSQRGFVRYYDLHQVAEERQAEASTATPAIDELRQRMQQSVSSHLMADVPVGVFLSGGLDSSIIAALMAQQIPELHSFSVGMAGSPDLHNARQVARYLGTQHHEHIYTVPQMIDALPRVIYHLESFDPALVRSAIANYFLARLARPFVKVILSGEGADELFSGYHYLKQFETGAALQQELVEITTELHNRNLQRLDRMTMAHGIEGRVPFLDRAFVEFAFELPIEQKMPDEQHIEKWMLRKAFEDLLPEAVVWRSKQKFAEGAGSAHVFQQLAESQISLQEFRAAAEEIFEEAGHWIRSREELYYYRIFRRFFPASVVPLVGFSRSL